MLEVVVDQDALAVLSRAKEERAERTPELQKEIDRLNPIRQSQWSTVNSLHHGRYQGLRDKRRAVLASIVERQCSACHMSISSQVVNEVRAQRRVHTCRSCGRFLYDVKESGTQSHS